MWIKSGLTARELNNETVVFVFDSFVGCTVCLWKFIPEQISLSNANRPDLDRPDQPTEDITILLGTNLTLSGQGLWMDRLIWYIFRRTMDDQTLVHSVQLNRCAAGSSRPHVVNSKSLLLGNGRHRRPQHRSHVVASQAKEFWTGQGGPPPPAHKTNPTDSQWGRCRC